MKSLKENRNDFSILRFLHDLHVLHGVIGIGTSPGPGLRLDVNGDAMVRGITQIAEDGVTPDTSFYASFGVTRANVAQNNAYIGLTKQWNISWGIGIDSGSSLIFGLPTWSPARTIPSPFVTITPAGSVGIGAASPGYKLEVRGPNLMLDNRGGATDFIFGDGNYRYFSLSTTASPNSFAIKDYTLGNTLMTITSSGNVGIGTANPQAKLDTAGSIRRSGTYYPALWREEIISGDARSGNTLVSSLSQNYVMNADNNNPLSTFRWYNAFGTPLSSVDISALTPLMVLNSAGNVGIGTPAPAAKLDVNGDAIVRGPLYLNYSDNRIQAIGVGSSYGNAFLAFSAFGYPYPENFTTVLVPAKRGFQVNDHANSTANIHVQDDGHLWVRVSPVLYSDSRIKLDQRELDYGLAQVMALKPKRYNRADWTEDMKTGKIIIHPEKKKNDIGLVAQDIQEIIPEAVVVPDKEGEDKLLGIAYPKLIPVLIKAIQDQQKQIEKLEDKITRLEKKIKDQVK